MVVIVPERKARKVEQLRAAAQEVMAALKPYAARHGGRFFVFGSVASGDIRFDSDFDVAVDFDPARERAAQIYADETCRRFGIVPDSHFISDISPRLKSRLQRDAIVLP